MVYTPLKTRVYETSLKMQLRLFKANHIPLKVPIEPLALGLRFYLEFPKKPKWSRPAVRPDLDNFCKSVKDAANGILWKDDGQIVFLIAEKVYSYKPGLEIFVSQSEEYLATCFLQRIKN